MPDVVAEYNKAQQKGATQSGNGLLFGDKTLNGSIKYSIYGLSVVLGAYALFEMPVSCSSLLKNQPTLTARVGDKLSFWC